jgi:hypothetical protein
MLVLSDDRGKFQFSTLGIKILNAFLFYANFYDGHLRLENPSSFDFMLIPPPEWSTGAEALDYASKLN